jgi:hypothetical protein
MQLQTQVRPDIESCDKVVHFQAGTAGSAPKSAIQVVHKFGTLDHKGGFGLGVIY